jgi:hypothetical protein
VEAQLDMASRVLESQDLKVTGHCNSVQKLQAAPHLVYHTQMDALYGRSCSCLGLGTPVLECLIQLNLISQYRHIEQLSLER